MTDAELDRLVTLLVDARHNARREAFEEAQSVALTHGKIGAPIARDIKIWAERGTKNAAVHHPKYTKILGERYA